MYNLGFDIGGSSIKVAVMRQDKLVKTTLKKIEKIASADQLTAVLTPLIQQIKASLGEEAAGVGFAVAGVMDRSRDQMLNSPNLAYLNGQPIRKILEEAAGLSPVVVENDANCFLAMERRIGLAQEIQSPFYLTLGTGIGAALMIEGRLARGAHGACSEAGHLVLDVSEGRDFEDLASNKLLQRRLGMGARAAERQAAQGNEEALAAFKELGANLGAGIATIINIVDPEAVIIAGGVALAHIYFEEEMRVKIKELVTAPSARETPVIFNTSAKRCRFGGAMGAALLSQSEAAAID